MKKPQFRVVTRPGQLNDGRKLLFNGVEVENVDSFTVYAAYEQHGRKRTVLEITLSEEVETVCEAEDGSDAS
jgi:hypothetical protein